MKNDQTPINPFLVAKENIGFVMEMLVKMHGGEVRSTVQKKAQEVVQAEVEANNRLSLLDLVEAFDRIPELSDFSKQLRKVSLPGEFGKSSSNPGFKFFFAAQDLSQFEKIYSESDAKNILANANTIFFLRPEIEQKP